jgi:26S proteasome regulatory subunit N1
LELLVTVITEPVDPTKAKDSEGVKQQALVQLRNHIRTSTSSMTSVPKPLKFLRPHYAHLKEEYERWPDSNESKWELADILSVLAMTQPQSRAAAAEEKSADAKSEGDASSAAMSDALPPPTAAAKDSSNERESLKYKLVSRAAYLKSSAYKKAQAAKATAAAAPADGTSAATSSSTSIGTDIGSVGSWGHEYVRNLAGEIGKEYAAREERGESVSDLEVLVDEILPFFIEHNADFDAIDLLLEVEQLDKLAAYVTKDNVQRINMYMLRCSDYVATTEEKNTLLELIFNNFLVTEQWSDALRLAIKLHSVSGGSTERIQSVMDHEKVSSDPLLAKQLGFILGSLRIVPEGVKEDENVMEAVGNVHLSAYFQQLASDLDVKEAKTPEDIYKSHLDEAGHGRRGARQPAPGATTGVDSAKQNLASTFVNAFLNAGFGKDLLITPEGSDWLYKNKSYGMLSATASLGLLNLWDVESGFSAVDKYSFSAQTHIKAGAALAHGMLSSGITSDMDAAQALLSEHLESKDADMKLGAVFGLGLAYTGTARDDVLELLMPLIVDGTQSIELVAHACLSLGLVYLGTANDDIAGSILEVLMERKSSDLDDPVSRFICLAIGLLFLGTSESCEGILLALAAVEHPLKRYLLLTVETCAYAGSNSVLQIQKLLGQLTEHVSSDEDEKEPTKLVGLHQEIAVLGIAMVAMGEELAQEMALRSLDHVLQYGEANVRRVVPLALGLLSLSNPRLTIMDTLSKLSHDQDERVSQHAVFAMGLLGAGTNNSRLATILRQLATYYAKEPNHLFLVRIAQGLLHLGKGLLTLSPVQSDQLLLNKTSLAGLLVVLHASLDMKSTLLSAKRHYLLFALTPAIRPRWLITLDGDSGASGDELKPIAIPVRVGSRVDTVGQAGRPKTITGFQTHKTPVLLSSTDRAELASDEFIALTKTLEGVVIVKKNPNYKKPE